MPPPICSSSRRALLQRGLAGATALAAGRAGATEPGYPTRPITLIVPWPAGGPTDITMRVLARAAALDLGVPLVVENRPGAGGAVAIATLLAAAPDGHTAMQLPITLYRVPYQQKVSWDPVRDLEPVLQITEVTFGIVVQGDSPWRTFADVLDWARRRPGELVVGSTGQASTPHLVIADLMKRHRLDYVHVPFKGAADQLHALQSNTIMVGVSSTGFAHLVDAGRLRLLATFNERRSRRWPNVPTMKELGHDIVATSPYGIAVARGTPRAVIGRLHEAFAKAIFDPEHVAELRKYDQEPAYLATEPFRDFLDRIARQERHWAEQLITR